MKKIVDNNYLVVQSNALIEAQYRLDALPQKIIRYLISKIKPSDTTFKERFYRLEVDEFATITGRGYTGKAIEDIRVASELLLTEPLTIWQDRRLLARVTWIAIYKHHLDEGWFEYGFRTELERELLKIANRFTQYQFLNVAKLKSQYSIRLYELLKQRLIIGGRKVLIDDLKAMLGIEKNEYTYIKDFRVRVLQTAHIEILAKTDIAYNWRTYKHVRKIVGVEFYDIYEKAKPIPAEVTNILPSQYHADAGILANIQTWTERKGVDYVCEKIIYTVSRNPAKFGDYLFKALENDHGKGFKMAQEAPEKPKPRKVASEAQVAKQAAKTAEKKKAEEELEAEKWIEAKKRFDCLCEAEKEKILAEFERTGVPSFLGMKMARQEGGYVSPATQVLFKGYLKAKLL